MEKKLKKRLANCSLLIVKDLGPAYYQVLIGCVMTKNISVDGFK